VSQNNKNKMKHGDAWLYGEQVIRDQCCTSAAALDFDSNQGKNGEMGCNVISPIDLFFPMKLCSRDSVSEFQAGAQAVIASSKLDIKNDNSMASDAIEFRPATASASAAIMSLDAVVVHPVTTVSATATASDFIVVCPAATALAITT
jgi:hypothetical protein